MNGDEMTRHSTDPGKSLRRSNGGTGPRRYQNHQAVTGDADARARFNPRPGAPMPDNRAWWEKLRDLFIERRDEREERRDEAHKDADFTAAIERLEAGKPLEDKRTPEELDELRETIERLTGKTPDRLPTLTAAEWVDGYGDGMTVALRTTRRIQEGRDPATGIDPVTGLDDFDMNAEQRAHLQRRFNAGQVRHRELPKSKATGKRWLEDGMTAVGTWRDTNEQVDPRSRHRLNPADWYLTPLGYMNVNGTWFGDNGLTYDQKTPEEQSLRLERLRSEEAQAEADDQWRREQQIAALFDAERFSYRY
jgi:hypothetical protein